MMSSLSFSQKLACNGVLLYRVIRGGLDSLCQSVFGVTIHCKHTPSCSEYTIRSIKEHGTITGLTKGLSRILRCW